MIISLFEMNQFRSNISRNHSIIIQQFKHQNRLLLSALLPLLLKASQIKIQNLMQFLIEEKEKTFDDDCTLGFEGNIGGQAWQTINQNVLESMYHAKQKKSPKRASLNNQNTFYTRNKRTISLKINKMKTSLHKQASKQNNEKNKNKYFYLSQKGQKNEFSKTSQQDKNQIKGLKRKIQRKPSLVNYAKLESEKQFEINLDNPSEGKYGQKTRVKKIFTMNFYSKKKKTLKINNYTVNKTHQNKENHHELKIYTNEKLKETRQIHSLQSTSKKKKTTQVYQSQNSTFSNSFHVGINIRSLQPRSRKLIL